MKDYGRHGRGRPRQRVLHGGQRTDAIHYIFISTPELDTALGGRGTVNRGLGIVFNNSSITAAHEVGHNFGLLHTFVDRQIPQATTRNIMDYRRRGEADRRRLFFWYQIRHIMTR